MLVNLPGKQLEAGIAVVLADGEFVIGAGEQALSRRGGAILRRLTRGGLHTGDGVLVQREIARRIRDCRQ